jgi:hypothetical protein
VPENEIPSPAPKKAMRFRWLRVLMAMAFVFVVLVVAVGLTLRFYGYDLAKDWLESPAGARVAGKELGKAIKVDGTFAPLKLNGWTIETASFTSIGWSGEAIGSLDCYDIKATFDPTAIWTKHAWRFSSIETDHVDFRMLKPNDALKRVMPPKKPKPWYAFLLPDHFECGPIITPHGNILFSFQGADSGIKDAHVQADLIGKDLKYTATSGTLDFPYLPPLHINRLEMLVTRPAITVYTAQLVGMDPADPASLTLSGRIGMREDKSIDATVAVNEMEIEEILPENLRPLIHGKISGNLTWKRTASGDNVTSEGDLKFTHASIDNLSVFKAVADLNSNPDLHEFAFSTATCHYRLDHGVVTLQLDARAAGKFHVAGTISYTLKTKQADLNLVFDELPLKIWLPPDFKPRYSGEAKATMQFHGQLDTKKDATAAITVNLDGTHISDPQLLRKLLAKQGLRTPVEIQFDKAQFSFAYADEIFKCTQAQLIAPGVLSAQLTGSLAPDKTLVATMDWQGLMIQDWLPEKYARQFSGALGGHATVAVQKWKFGNGSYGGNMSLIDGTVNYTAPQTLLGRFLNQRGILEEPLKRMQLTWGLNDRDATVQDLDIRLGDDIGVKGDLDSDDEKGLSGKIWIGMKPEYLEWLPEAKTIFTRSEDGLIWAPVKVSGTLKKPQQDLSGRIVDDLTSHPFALIGLSGKLVSWYVGNWFGAQQEWERPQTKNVEVGATVKKP